MNLPNDTNSKRDGDGLGDAPTIKPTEKTTPEPTTTPATTKEKIKHSRTTNKVTYPTPPHPPPPPISIEMPSYTIHMRPSTHPTTNPGQDPNLPQLKVGPVEVVSENEHSVNPEVPNMLPISEEQVSVKTHTIDFSGPDGTEVVDRAAPHVVDGVGTSNGEMYQLPTQVIHPESDPTNPSPQHAAAIQQSQAGMQPFYPAQAYPQPAPAYPQSAPAYPQSSPGYPQQGYAQNPKQVPGYAQSQQSLQQSPQYAAGTNYSQATQTGSLPTQPSKQTDSQTDSPSTKSPSTPSPSESDNAARKHEVNSFKHKRPNLFSNPHPTNPSKALLESLPHGKLNRRTKIKLKNLAIKDE